MIQTFPERVGNTWQLLQCLLRKGLGHSGTLPHVADTSDLWPDVFRLAAAHGVQAIAWDGLQQFIAEAVLPQEAQPSREVRLRWFGSVAQTEQQYALQRATLQRLADFYAGHDIPTMVLKGYGLSLLYPIPQHRTCCDIDIWLFGHQQEADKILAKASGIHIGNAHHHHSEFMVDGVQVENHYDFINVNAHLSSRQVEKRLKVLAAQPGGKCHINDTDIFLPPTDFNALFLLRHAASHFASEVLVLRQVADWAMFVEKHGKELDWEALENFSRKQNMLRFLLCLNALAVDVMGIDAALMPPFTRDRQLEQRVLADILKPEFSETEPAEAGLARRVAFRTKRWWANRWKHRICYRESLWLTFLVQVRSHLMKPDTLK